MKFFSTRRMHNEMNNFQKREDPRERPAEHEKNEGKTFIRKEQELESNPSTFSKLTWDPRNEIHQRWLVYHRGQLSRIGLVYRVDSTWVDKKDVAALTLDFPRWCLLFANTHTPIPTHTHTQLQFDAPPTITMGDVCGAWKKWLHLV